MNEVREVEIWRNELAERERERERERGAMGCIYGRDESGGIEEIDEATMASILPML